jgi:hypothetical protein
MMPLVLRNCNPTPEALARGLEAAHAVLAAVNIAPHAAWLQSGYHVAWTDAVAMQAWYRAEDAAVRAAFGSWRAAPMAVAMEWEPGPPGAEDAA